MTHSVQLPDFALVLMVGASGSGKSSFAARHFAPTEILSSDRFRALVCDDENDQTATGDAFDLLHRALEARLRRRRFTVVDATNLEARAREPLRALAKEHDCWIWYFVMDPALEKLQRRRRSRSDRKITAGAVRAQHLLLKRILKELGPDERVVRVPELARHERMVIERVDPWAQGRADRGPFDLIGDVHGCYGELTTLLMRLGYLLENDGALAIARHPEGRKLVFLGDLVDRGPAIVEVLRLVMGSVRAGTAYCVLGNHDFKLARLLRGKQTSVTHGLQASIDQIAHAEPDFAARVVEFVAALPNHLILDQGRLVAVHGAIKPTYIGRDSGRVQAFALYGDTTGEKDERGLPIRLDWSIYHDASCAVVYGHTPVSEPIWKNETLCIDTGCVYGGALTALRWPERELVRIPAERVHYQGSLRA